MNQSETDLGIANESQLLGFGISEAYGHRNVLAAATAASRLSRTFTTLVETLRRLRSGGSQVIRIERVDVRDGGQAVIGNVKSDKLYG